MKRKLAWIAAGALVVCSVAALSASTSYLDVEACDSQGWHTTGYRVTSTVNHSGGVGYGNVSLQEATCNNYNNNTIPYTLQVYVEVRNTVTWELLSAGYGGNYYWEGNTTACEVTFVMNISGERYEGEFFSLPYNSTPASCDP